MVFNPLTILHASQEDPVFVVNTVTNAEEVEFDRILGALEDILVDDEFSQLQNDFMSLNYSHFNDTDENKFIYTDLHKQYIQILESFIELRLKRVLGAEFTLNTFIEMCRARKVPLEGDVIDMLLPLSDFITFKEMMLFFKSQEEGAYEGFDNFLSITHHY